MEDRVEFNRNYAAILELVSLDALEGRGAYFPEPKSPDLAEVRAHAEENAIRLTTMAILPARVASFASKAAVLDLVAQQRLNHFNYSLPIRSVSDQIIQQQLSGLSAVNDGLRQHGSPQPSEMVSHAHWLENMMAERKDTYVNKGTDALYASVIVMAYTLVETIADDLWIAAVNARPKTLASNVIKRRVGEDRPAKLQEPSITLRELSDYGFNVSESMGEFLAYAGRVSLDTVKRMMDTYRDAFWNPLHQKSYKPCVELNKIFEEFEPDLFILERLRNMLVHQGGNIDDVFFEQVRYKNDHGLGTINESDVGNKLPLNGAVVVRYTVCAMNFSRKLLRFVDDWLAKYPDPK